MVTWHVSLMQKSWHGFPVAGKKLDELWISSGL